MRRFLLLLALVVASAAVDVEEPLERDEIIDAVNNAKTTWRAGKNFDPTLKKNYLKSLLGLKKNPNEKPLPLLPDDNDDSVELPETFDARQKWDKCISLQEVRDQGPCGSCWAVASATAFTDRLCIATKTSWNGFLSAENLISCCKSCGDGCDGGSEVIAWDYFETNGIVTGGDYHSHEGCQPYTLPTCEHHVSGKRKNCATYGNLPTPACKTTCYNKNYKTQYENDFHKVKSTFLILQNVKKMQQELLKNGPLVAGFTVYEDFLSYKSGVYHHVTGAMLGGHAVKVIGWGTENGTPYWLVANSWNTDWGDKGFFKIKRGNDECEFEEMISGGTPDV